MAKLNPTCPRKTEVPGCGVSAVGGKVEELRRKSSVPSVETMSFESGVEVRSNGW